MNNQQYHFNIINEINLIKGILENEQYEEVTEHRAFEKEFMKQVHDKRVYVKVWIE